MNILVQNHIYKELIHNFDKILDFKDDKKQIKIKEIQLLDKKYQYVFINSS